MIIQSRPATIERHHFKVGKFDFQRAIKDLALSTTDLLFSPNRSFLLVLDVVVLFSCFVIASWKSPWGTWGKFEDYLLVGGSAFSLSFTMIAVGLGYYERTRRYSYWRIVTVGVLATLLALPIGLATAYFTYYGVFGRLTFLAGASGAYFGITLFRLSLGLLYRRIPYCFSIIGTSQPLEELTRFFADTQNRESKYYQQVNIAQMRESGGEISLSRLQEARVNDFVFARDALASQNLLNIAMWAMQNNFRIIDEIDFYSNTFEKIPIESVSISWLVQREIGTRKFWSRFIKRLIDIVVSAVGLLLLSPLLLLIALIIKLTSPGPVLFIQPRQGRYCRPFDMYKFRTMKIQDSRKDASGGFTRVGDDRLTAVGKILRPLHLDELPQLLNILTGSMSLVGPRPEAHQFAQRMSKEHELYDVRYLLRPGLTGHAQLLTGYMMDTIEDTKQKLQFDLYYIVNQNVSLDLRILLRTIFVVLKRALERH